MIAGVLMTLHDITIASIIENKYYSNYNVSQVILPDIAQYLI
jgi:hypothetical protein